MMDLQVRCCAADLALPRVSLQDLTTKLFVGFRIQFQPRLLGPNPTHEAFWFACARNSCLCSLGRNLKNCRIECSSISGFPLSRFAPARKSAQIISRQYPRDLSLPSIKAAVSIACSITGIWLLYTLK